MIAKMLISRENYRILELLRDFVYAYKGLEKVAKFVYKLEEYCFSIEKLDKEAAQELYNYWWEFEQIYASYLSEGRDEPNNQERILMEETYGRLSQYCNSLLEKYKPEPEDPYAWPFESVER